MIGVEDLAALGLMGVALYTDLTTMRVPNKLTFGGMALGLVWTVITVDPRWFGAAGIALAFACMFPAFAAGKTIRAGDAKLLMAVGAFWGPYEIFETCAWTYILSLPFGLIVLAYRGRLGNILPALKAGFRKVTGKQSKDDPEPELTKVAFVPCIVIAALVARFTEVLSFQ
ncbi:MAG: prepilin peptidase [Proteobacteria bacterium]|nr:prepilin peptidase [Pseudomonadota bacterium]MCP4917513.1 prepilin peptidase [Pseudomonadota bacterium]